MFLQAGGTKTTTKLLGLTRCLVTIAANAKGLNGHSTNKFSGSEKFSKLQDSTRL